MSVNLKQRLKNMAKRNWGDKTIKQNVDYLKKQLKDFGLEAPKYLKQGRLTKNNINALINKLNRQGERITEQKRNYGMTLDRGSEKAIKSLLKDIKVAEKKYIKSYEGELDYYAISTNKTVYFGGDTHIPPPVRVQNFKSMKHLFKVQEPKDTKELMEYLVNYKGLLEENVKEKAKLTAVENINNYSEMLLDLGEVEQLSNADVLTHDKHIEKKVMELSVSQLRYVEALLQKAEIQQLIESLVSKGYTYHDAFDVVIFQLYHADSLVFV